MATLTISSIADLFPVGTSVGAYPLSNWNTSQLPPAGAPQGSATASASVASDGSLVIANLADATWYLLSASVSGTYRYRRARTTVAAATTSVDVTGTLGDSRLKYAPPQQSYAPTVVSAGTGFFNNGGVSFGDDEDVIVVLPGSARTGSIDCTGGRHVRIIGGQITNTSAGSAIRWRGNNLKSVFIEGLLIDHTGTTEDAINVYGIVGSNSKPDCYIQNCRIVNVNGANAGQHADVFQPQGPMGRLFVDKLTFSSNYQGLFMSPQYPILGAYISRTNAFYAAIAGDATTQLFWFLGTTQATQYAYPVELADVYVAPRAAQAVNDSVWPAAGQTRATDSRSIGAITASDGSVSWPPETQISGSIKSGTPSSGDYVPAVSVGLSYVTPGYMEARPVKRSEPRLPRLWVPADNAMVAASFDPAMIGGAGFPLVTGTVYWMRVPIDYTTPIADLFLWVTTAGSTLTANQNICAVYNAKGTVKIGHTADQSATWNGGGAKKMALTADAAVLEAEEGHVWVAVLSVGTTPPQMGKNPFATTATKTSANTNLSGASLRAAVGATTQTTLPATIDPTTFTEAQGQIWLGFD